MRIRIDFSDLPRTYPDRERTIWTRGLQSERVRGLRFAELRTLGQRWKLPSSLANYGFSLRSDLRLLNAPSRRLRVEGSGGEPHPSPAFRLDRLFIFPVPSHTGGGGPEKSRHVAGGALAQAPAPYGAPISLENAKKAAAGAAAEARKNNWTMVIAVTDISGNLVYFEKMDGTQNGDVNVAIAKSRSAAIFKRPTKAFADDLAAGGAGLRYLALEGALPVEGGVPIVMDGKIVGAIGASGGAPQQDGQVAKAGADAVK